jgi:hypothetical protein
MPIARLDITTELSEKESTQMYVLQMALRETLLGLEEGAGRADPEAASSVDLAVHCQYHQQVHPEAACLTCPQCIHGFGTPCITTGGEKVLLSFSGG